MTDQLDALYLSFQEAVLGSYSLERELGRGGMGVVYLARDARLDRRVAIKLLPPDAAAQPAIRDRFLREARTAARLSHPHIVPIHTVGEIGDFVFYVMTYVEGETLAQRVATSGPLTPARTARLLREVAWALAYSHGQGVVHRDVKPANILIEAGTERALVTDFGIARMSHLPGQTARGELLGTPEYMSPEQAAGEAVDGRSDLYSLGITGYFALTGQLPFTGAAHVVLAQQLTRAAPPMASVTRSAPRALTTALDRCLAKDPGERYATGEQLVEALSKATEARAETPVPLRAFLGPSGNVLILSPALGVLMGVAIHVSPGESALLLRWMPIALGVLAPAGMVLGRLRRLAREGYGAHDIAGAIRQGFERRREELLFDRGPTESRQDRIVRTVTTTLTVVGGLAWLEVFALLLPMSRETYHILLGLLNISGPFATLGLLAAIPAVVSSRMHRLRKGYDPTWAKFWDSRIGRWLTRVASWKLRDRRIAADRPTELAIAASVESLFDALPRATRESLADVPAVARQLQARAEEARARIAALEVAATEAAPHSERADVNGQAKSIASDIGAARRAAEDRLANLVTALETLRLDLLRLQAGVGTAETLTLDLEAAASVAEQVDRLVEARKEVDAIGTRT